MRYTSMSTLPAALFFTAYVPVTAYVACRAFWSSWAASRPVLLFGDTAFFRSASAAFLFATMMMMGCVTLSLVYAAEMLVGGRKRIVWQLGMLLLPFAGPSCFYFFVVRHRASIWPRLLRANAALTAVLSGGLPACLGMVAATVCSSKALHLISMLGLFAVAGYWAFAFWRGRTRAVEDFFSALTAAGAAGAVYGILAQGLIVPAVAGLGAGVCREALSTMSSIYWGAVGGAFGACCLIVVPGFLGGQVEGVRQAIRRRTMRDTDVREVRPRR